eukprot:5584321-Prymnesium_polylepis.1
MQPRLDTPPYYGGEMPPTSQYEHAHLFAQQTDRFVEQGAGSAGAVLVSALLRRGQGTVTRTKTKAKAETRVKEPVRAT